MNCPTLVCLDLPSASREVAGERVARLAGDERRLTLGEYPTVGLAEARAKAAEVKRLVRSGVDASATGTKNDGQSSAPIDADLIDRYVADHLRRNELRAGSNAEKQLRLHVGAAWNTGRSCRSRERILSCCLRKCASDSRSRSRMATGSNAASVEDRGPRSSQVRAIIQGLSRGEAGSFLFSTAGQRLFPVSKAKARLDRRLAKAGNSDIAPWVVHDLRRSMATHTERSALSRTYRGLPRACVEGCCRNCRWLHGPA